MRTADLVGAYLDYFTGLADGKPKEKLSIRRVPRTGELICVYNGIVRYDPSTNGEKTIDLMHRNGIDVMESVTKVDGNFRWCAGSAGQRILYGPTIPIAVCRMRVFMECGTEVPDIEITE